MVSPINPPFASPSSLFSSVPANNGLPMMQMFNPGVSAPVVPHSFFSNTSSLNMHPGSNINSMNMHTGSNMNMFYGSNMNSLNVLPGFAQNSHMLNTNRFLSNNVRNSYFPPAPQMSSYGYDSTIRMNSNTAFGSSPQGGEIYMMMPGVGADGATQTFLVPAGYVQWKRDEVQARLGMATGCEEQSRLTVRTVDEAVRLASAGVNDQSTAPCDKVRLFL